MPHTDKDARFWNRIARKYATDPIADMAGYERTLEATWRLLKPGDQVFEFGCGTGSTALKLAPSVARYLATDISSVMIAIGREKAAAQGIGNAVFEIASPDAAHLPDNTFDAVLGFNILHLIQAREAALTNVRRILKLGGLFISKTPCLAELNPIYRIAVPLMQALGKAPYVRFENTAELERDIAAAGFEIIERARHASKGKDARPFLVARKT